MRFQLPKFMTMTSTKPFSEFVKAFRYQDKKNNRSNEPCVTTTTLIQHSVQFGSNSPSDDSDSSSIQPMDIDDDSSSTAGLNQ